MDFARPLIHQETVATRSKVRHIPLPQEEENEAAEKTNNNASSENQRQQEGENDDGAKDRALDRLALQSANDAARVMLLGGVATPFKHLNKNKTSAEHPKKKAKTDQDNADSDGDDNSNANKEDSSLIPWIDTALYTQRSLPEPDPTIQVGDLVVLQISFRDLTFAYAERNAITSNRNGHFHHNDFIGKLPFGSLLQSRKKGGHCYLLKPTPELWIRSLPHRTQIVHELDQSQILMELQLTPNATVIESGTGSAALTHTLTRTIAPHGHVYSYEFHQKRAQTAMEELERHGLGHLATVQHADVCQVGFPGLPLVRKVEDNDNSQQSSNGNEKNKPAVDAVFLDLPEPWHAIPHAAYCLKPNGRLASYSPCLEQTQRAIQAMEAAGFHSIQTWEFRTMEFYVDAKVQYKAPPFDVPRPSNLDTRYDHAASASINNTFNVDDNNNNSNSNSRKKRKKRKDYRQEEKNEHASKDEKEELPSQDLDSQNQGNTDGTAESKLPSTDAATTITGGTQQHAPLQLMARPFGTIRGHTAFLTFATAGLVPQPKPAHFCHELPKSKATDEGDKTK